jgi:hypothetical protein
MWQDGFECMLRYRYGPICAECLPVSPRPDSHPSWREMIERACLHCGRVVFVNRYRAEHWERLAEPWRLISGGRAHRIFCCEDCREAYNRSQLEQRRARATEARAKVCATCDQPFTATRADAVTCSPACRQKAYRARKSTR